MDGGKILQIERKPSNDWVKGEPEKMAPGERKTQSLSVAREASCLSAHVHERTSQKARRGFREIEAQCLSSGDGLGYPGNWLTRGNLSLAR